MTDSNPISNAPVITTPEASVEGMVAPGQEDLLQEFVDEQQAQEQEEPEKLLGKFKSTEDLARAYQQLEKKLGQRETLKPEAPNEPRDPASETYTQDEAVAIYGSDAVEALNAKGIDMAELMQRGDAGEDISEHYDALAETFNVSRQMVENYVNGAQQGEAVSSQGLTDADEASIKEVFGGEQGFQDLSTWAVGNLPQQELDSYNAVVDSGNRDAILWALKAIEARRAAPDAVVEPRLISGAASREPRAFESQQQVLDAMNKRNERGQRLYDVDEAYRNKVVKLLEKSNVF